MDLQGNEQAKETLYKQITQNQYHFQGHMDKEFKQS